MADSTRASVGSEVHRLLDEAFAGVAMTPDTQDLKEEMRANLLARISELETTGTTPADAARQAIDELGDIRELLEVSADERGGVAQDGWEVALQRHRVRPKPAFVVGIVVAGIAALIGLLLAMLGALGALPLPIGPLFAFTGLAATGCAWIVGDWLAHETTTNHPMPAQRAGGYFFATLLAVYGLGLAGLVLLGALPAWTVVFAALGVVAALILFAFLIATQTNRRKAWVRALRRERPTSRNRFTEEPEVAVRFAIYTMVIWVLAFAAFVLVGSTAGWVWSWLALLCGFAAMMILLARMLFR